MTRYGDKKCCSGIRRLTVTDRYLFDAYLYTLIFLVSYSVRETDQMFIHFI